MAEKRNKKGQFIKGIHSASTTEFMKGEIPWNKGKIGYSTKWKGRHHTLKTKNKMRKLHKKGWKHSKETKLKLSLLRMGEKNPAWKGGNSSACRAKKAPRPKPEQCEICGSLGILCYDHDHKTGKFRGWICYRCNFALGLVKDNTETLIALIEYIKKYKI